MIVEGTSFHRRCSETERSFVELVETGATSRYRARQMAVNDFVTDSRVYDEQNQTNPTTFPYNVGNRYARSSERFVTYNITLAKFL